MLDTPRLQRVRQRGRSLAISYRVTSLPQCRRRRVATDLKPASLANKFGLRHGPEVVVIDRFDLGFGGRKLADVLPLGATAMRFDTVDGIRLDDQVDSHFDVGQEIAFIAGDEGECGAFRFARRQSPGAADAMDVIVAVLWDVVVDDVRDAADIDPASHHVGGDEQSDRAIAELAHHSVACCLSKITVNERRLLQPTTEPAKDFFGTALGACEDDRLLRPFLDEQSDQDRELSIVIDGDVVLVDGVAAHRVDRHVDPFRLLHVALSESFDRSWQRGGQEQRLSIRRAAPQNSLDVGTETDVQHSVGFIEDDDFQMVQDETATLHQVNHTTGRSDHDLSTTLQLIHLSSERSSTDAAGRRNFVIGRESDGFVGNLLAEFSCGSEDQRLSPLIVEVHSFQDRQDKRCCLAGTGAGLSDAIASRHGDRNEGGLNRAGGLESNLAEHGER